MSPWPLDRNRRTRILAVDREQLAWTREGGNGSPTFASHPHGEGLPVGLRENLKSVRPGLIDVIAANDLALHWVQTPPASVASFAELRLVAQTRCAHLYGGSPDDWRLGADWQTSRPFVCAAIPQGVATSIEQQLAACQLAPRWHSAWSLLTCCMPQAFAADGWNAVRSTTRVVLWHCQGAQVDCMASWPADAKETSSSAAGRAVQQMQLETSRVGYAQGKLHWLDLVAPAPDPAAAQAFVAVASEPRFAAISAGAIGEAAVALALGVLIGEALP